MHRTITKAVEHCRVVKESGMGWKPIPFQYVPGFQQANAAAGVAARRIPLSGSLTSEGVVMDSCRPFLVGLLFVLTFVGRGFAQGWPKLPVQDAAVEIPAQEWPQRPGPRTVRVLIHYPSGSLNGVTPQTGIMLTLHNWGGTDCVGTADPRELARRLNVVAVCVNYLQSGRADSIDGPEPYDHGYLQSLDALRALWFVREGLKSQGKTFRDDRLFCTGGSGGGNVTLMANKLAPRTFACVIDMCGMKKLSDDIAFHLPGGTDLNARWSRDPRSKNFLSIDEQELRFVGHPQHLAAMKQLGATSKIVVVHGVDDATCPYADAVEMVELMRHAGLDVEPKFVTKADLDGKVFTSTGHSLGNRTQIVLTVAGRYLAPDGKDSRRRTGPTDFDRRESLRYRTTNGQFVIAYDAGYPVGRFEPAPPPIEYRDHHGLLYWLDREGGRHAVRTVEDWQTRRQHIVENLQLAMGPLPSPLSRVSLDVRVMEEVRLDPPRVARSVIRQKLTFQSDANDRVPAYLLIPAEAISAKQGSSTRRPAVLCLHQTTAVGKDEPVGIRGDPTLKYALELAERGFITLAPDYPSLGEHAYDFQPERGYVSGSMKAVWDNIRAVDVLQSLAAVDPARIGCIGHSLGGHSAIFTAVFEPRLKVIVSSCGFTNLHKDDIPSWTGPRYMPRIASVFQNDPARVPFDFHELIGAIAPRPFLACAAMRDSDFDVSGVRDVMQAAKTVYELHRAAADLAAIYPDAPHSFPNTTRLEAYTFLERHLHGTTPQKENRP
jgi:predicted peptidase